MRDGYNQFRDIMVGILCGILILNIAVVDIYMIELGRTL